MNQPNTNYIPPIGLFHTPATMLEVQEWIAQHLPSDRPALSTVAFMTYNLLATEYNKAVRERNEVIQELVAIIEDHCSNEQVVSLETCKSIADLSSQYPVEVSES